MVHYFALSIFLFPIVTVLGSQFWDDVDSIYNQLSDPQDTLTEPTPPAPLNSLSPMELYEKQLKRTELLKRKFFRKNITVNADEVEDFKRTIVIDKSYPQNISLAEMENKLLASGGLHEWFDIDTYDVATYPRYWGKVCLSLWGKPLVSSHKYYCTFHPSYGIHKMRVLQIGKTYLYFDLLSCKCHNYENNYKHPISVAETFLIHKSGDNEFYIFENINTTKDNRSYLNIKYFQGGITLPQPLSEDKGIFRNYKAQVKSVTLGADDIEIFNRSLNIIKLYPENISLAELEDKLMEDGEIHEWPDLCIYNLNTYFMYWANLCVSLWGKQLDRSHRQACIISTSYGATKTRKLFLKGRTLHFDLLYCQCQSHLSDFRYPISNADIFLIHRSNFNEFLVFEQREVGDRSFTLFIRDYKRVINLPELKPIR